MATTTTSGPATAAQQERIGELYDSRVVPEEKKRDPATMSERSAKRWIMILEAYPLKEETVAGIGGCSADPAKPKRRTRSAANEAKVKEPERKRPARRGKAQPKPATNGGTTDKARAKATAKAPAAKGERKPIDGKVAQRVVTCAASWTATGARPPGRRSGTP